MGNATSIDTLILSNSGNSLNINATGILGIQGGSTTNGISNAGTITINTGGTLRNDAASALHYSIYGTGSITLAGGTISTQAAGGIWDFNQAVSGYGTISAPVTNNSTITANNATALNITGALTNSGTLKAGTSTANRTGTLVFGTGGSLSGNAADVYGTLTNNTGSTMALAYFNLYGGTLNGANGFTNAATWSGYGAISAALTNSGTVQASSGTLKVSANVTNTGHIMNTAGSGSILELDSPATITAGSINPNGGTVNLGNATTLGATLSGVTLGAGTVNVLNTSTLSGTTTSSATIGIGSGKQLNMSGGTLDNSATVAVGSGTLNNTAAAAGTATLGSGGNVTLAGGSITSTGLGAFSSNNNITGYGTISAPLINTGTVTLSGGTSTVSGLFTNQGQLNVQSTATGTIFGNVTNESTGTVKVSGATVTYGNFTNNGVYQSDPATQIFSNLTVGPLGYLTGGTGDKFQIQNNFINNSTLNNELTQWNTTQAELAFITGASHNLSIPGVDNGQVPGASSNNFSWGTLDLTGQTIHLVDGNAAAGGALYVGLIKGLTFTGTTVDEIVGLSGLNIYYDPLLNPDFGSQTFSLGVANSSLMPNTAIPIPGSVLLLGTGLVGLGLLRFRRRKSN